MFIENDIHAQTVNFYVAETASSGGAASLVDYNFSTLTNSATQVGSPIALTGVFGGATDTESSLELSEDGTSLSYAGFTTATNGTSDEVLYNIAGGTTTTAKFAGTARSNYYGTSTDGTAGFYMGSGADGVSFVAPAGASQTKIENTSGFTSGNTIAYNPASSNLYVTRNSSSNGNGVYTPSANGVGLIPTTTQTTFIALSGGTNSGWNVNDVYNGLGFLGANNLFVVDTTVNTIDVFNAADATKTNDWNMTFSLANSDPSFTTTEPIEQLSVDQVDANDALIFFTTNGLAGTSTLDEVSFNTTTGFGSVNNLVSGTSEFFTGVAVIQAAPEPSTYALMGLGLGLMCLILNRRKVGRDSCLG